MLSAITAIGCGIFALDWDDGFQFFFDPNILGTFKLTSRYPISGLDVGLTFLMFLVNWVSITSSESFRNILRY